MEIKELKNKETGETLKTKEGKTLKEYKLEEGDKIIPSFDSVLKKETTTTDGKIITHYKIKCKARNNKDEDIEDDENNKEVFVTLTPTQANYLNKEKEKEVNITQHIYEAYSYESNNYGKQLGLGRKREQKTPITFE